MRRCLAFLILLIAGWPGNLLRGQSYQTQFGAIKFDRAKGPGTFLRGVEVDGGSGSLAINLPLGPGIGARGLRFQPVLNGFWSPQVEVYPMYIGPSSIDGVPTGSGDPLNWSEFPRAAASGGFDLTPGFFQLVFDEDGGESFTENYVVTKVPSQRLTHFQGPEGWSASVSLEEPLAGQVPTEEEALRLIRTFGFVDAGWVIGRMTDQDCVPSAAPFIRRGPSGELVLGLEHPTLAPRQYAVPIVGTAVSPGTSSLDSYFHFPSTFLVIRGDLAYEFSWRSNRYGTIERTFLFSGMSSLVNGQSQGLETWVGYRFLRHAAFALRSMRNRFGDKIDISANESGHWTASWCTSEGSTGASISWDGAILAYQGEGPQPSYKVEGISYNMPHPSNAEGVAVGPTALKQPFDGFKASKIGKLTFLSTGEEVRFDFAQEVIATNGYGMPVDTLEYPNSIAFPGRAVELRWNDRTEYLRNRPETLGLAVDHFVAMGDARVAGYAWLPVYRRGVDQIIESDSVSGGLIDSPSSATRRITTHARKIPQPARTTGAMWLNTAFYDVVTHPDGSSTLSRYVEPLVDDLGGPQSSAAGRMQTLAYLKHQVAEVRHYAVGVDPAADVTASRPAPGQSYLVPLDGSLAYKVEVHDRWDIRGAANPDGSFDLSAVPFATRVRTWDRLNQILETKEYTNWDRATRGWKAAHTIREQTDSAPDLKIEILSRAMTNQDTALLPANPLKGSYRIEAKTYHAEVAQWIFGRLESERVDVQADQGDGWGFTHALPASLPTILKTFDSSHPELNRLGSIQYGSGDEAVTTRYTYKGTAGMSAALLDSVQLRGLGEDLTGRVGVTYGYDTLYGFMNRISPEGVNWHLEQSSDSLGRATSQKDANGLTTGVTWDGAGRLVGIQPGSPELGVSIVPDADNRGYTVTHGSEEAQYRYNPFGELVLERRFNGSTWSHRLFGYDAAGRKVAETVWNPDRGDEAEWKAPNLVHDASVLTAYSPGHYEESCAKEDPVTGNCMKFVKIWEPASSQFTNATGLHNGTSYEYDGYGRLIRTMDPDGLATETAYGIRQMVVTLAPGTKEAVSTTYRSDADGRLFSVVDALGQTSEYRYDLGGRIASVVQWSGLRGTGPSQSRTWTYNSLGWLTDLTQPESGRTAFSGFTITGHPTIATYGAGSPHPRSVTTTFDSLSRVRRVVSEDGTIDRTIQFDEPDHGAGNNQTTSASEAGVGRSLIYGGLNGRLSSLTRTVDGRSFTMGLEWNADGTLHRRTYPDGNTQVIQYDAFRAMPNGVSFPGGGTATLAYDRDHWGLRNLTYGNGISTFLDYDPDQTRLRYLKHVLGDGAMLQDWSYRYDGVGRLGTDGEDFYGYDPLGRLTSVIARDVDPVTRRTAGSSHALVQSFDYDAFGNRKSLSTMALLNWAWGDPPPLPLATESVGGNRGLRSYAMSNDEIVSMAATNHLPQSLSGVLTGASYDEQGNLIQIQREPGSTSAAQNTLLRMGYDALGRVRTLLDPQRGVTEVYAYDDEGLRALVEIHQGIGTPTPQNLIKKVIRIYNEARQLVAEYDLVLE